MLNYRRVRAPLFCCEWESSHFCWYFWFRFLFCILWARHSCFDLPRGLSLTSFLAVHHASFFILLPFSAGLMPRNLKHTLCGDTAGLHTRRCAAVAWLSIPHLYVFARHSRYSRHLLWFYSLTTSITCTTAATSRFARFLRVLVCK